MSASNNQAPLRTGCVYLLSRMDTARTAPLTSLRADVFEDGQLAACAFQDLTAVKPDQFAADAAGLWHRTVGTTEIADTAVSWTVRIIAKWFPPPSERVEASLMLAGEQLRAYVGSFKKNDH